MKTQFSDINYAKRVAWIQAQAMHIYPLPIPFDRKEDKDKKKSKEDRQYRDIDVPLEKDSEDHTEWRMYMFDQGQPEQWIKWKIQWESFVEAFPLDTDEKKNKYLLTLLTGRAKDIYLNNNSELAKRRKNDAVDLALNEVAMNIFNNDNSSYRRQRNYLRYNLYFQEGELSEFKLRLYEQNKYLAYFPIPKGKTEVKSLDDDELLEILDRAKTLQYQQDCLKSNVDPYTKTPEEYLEFLERLETSSKIEAALNNAKPKTSSESKDKGKKGKGKGKGNKRQRDGESSERCSHCNKDGHAYAQCWYNPKNKSKRPKWVKDKKSDKQESSNSITLSTEQFNYLCTTLPKLNQKKKNKAKKKRKVREEDSSDEEYNNMIQKLSNSKVNDSESDSNYCCIANRRAKRVKISHRTTEVVGEITDKNGNVVPIRVLLDSGTTSTIVLREFINGQISRYKNKVTWNTIGGKFFTKRKALVDFKLPEFSENRQW